MRRLFSKLALGEAAQEVAAFLEPCQLGVGVPFGCEAVVHTARQWLGRNEGDAGKVMVMIDMANAFNTLDRSAVRNGVRRLTPPWPLGWTCATGRVAW